MTFSTVIDRFFDIRTRNRDTSKVDLAISPTTCPFDLGVGGNLTLLGPSMHGDGRKSGGRGWC